MSMKLKRTQMKKNIFYVLTFIVLFTACTKVPITGRKQMNLMPESEMMSMSLTEYNSFLKQNPPVSGTDANAQMIKNVGARIANAVTRYMQQNKMSDRIANYKWEFNLVNSKEVNAWCMPGGKVVVYSGLLPVTQDETGLAIVMGHEIAHAVARHGNERMSQMMMAQVGSTALDVALANKSAETRQIFSSAYGVGAQVGVLLPYSRLHESEADKLGLVFAAMAGYNPESAIPFWERMAKMGGSKPPELLSSHPSDATRIADLKKFMPEAKKYYKPQ